MLYYEHFHSTITYCNYIKEAVVPFFLTYEVINVLCIIGPRCQKNCWIAAKAFTSSQSRCCKPFSPKSFSRLYLDPHSSNDRDVNYLCSEFMGKLTCCPSGPLLPSGAVTSHVQMSQAVNTQFNLFC